MFACNQTEGSWVVLRLLLLEVSSILFIHKDQIQEVSGADGNDGSRWMGQNLAHGTRDIWSFSLVNYPFQIQFWGWQFWSILLNTLNTLCGFEVSDLVLAVAVAVVAVAVAVVVEVLVVVVVVVVVVLVVVEVEVEVVVIVVVIVVVVAVVSSS